MDTIIVAILQGPHGLSVWEFAALGGAILGFIVLPIVIIGFIIYRVVVGHAREREVLTSVVGNRSNKNS